MMKTVLGLIFLCLLGACANKPSDTMQDPSQAKADARARDEFAKTLPKPPER
jgi:hypothetical protein